MHWSIISNKKEWCDGHDGHDDDNDDDDGCIYP